MEVTCLSCEKTLDDGALHRCPVCFKHACEEHVHRMSGREFCSKGCAQFFFFSEPDDDDDE